EAIVGRSLPAEVDDPALGARAERILAECEALGIEVLPWGAEGYPGRLLALVDPPPVLFRRGRALPASRTVAIVGARRATPVGRRFAERIAAELSRAGVTIVSGLAYGIDAAAHRGGLQGAGSTVAVLGCGPDRAYPAGHRRLFEAILERGSVVGEFPPGEGARAHHFPRRN